MLFLLFKLLLLLLLDLCQSMTNVTSSTTYGSETQPLNSDDAITEGTLVLKAKFGMSVGVLLQ